MGRVLTNKKMRKLIWPLLSLIVATVIFATICVQYLYYNKQPSNFIIYLGLLSYLQFLKEELTIK
jgi:hypothetical protein